MKCCRGEMFTLQRLKLPHSPYKCLATANVIESPQSGVARRTANVTRWRDREMVERWVASAWLLKEKNFRKKIDGYRDLWALATILGRQPLVQPIAGEASVKYTGCCCQPSARVGIPPDGRVIQISAGNANDFKQEGG
jgi:hypothetical protein